MSSTQTHRYDESIIRFPHLIKHNKDIFSNIKFNDNVTIISGVFQSIHRNEKSKSRFPQLNNQ